MISLCTPKEWQWLKKLLLLVEDTSSTCCTCGKGADPLAKAHTDVINYSPGEKGCGVVFTHLATGRGKDTVEKWQQLREDLFFESVGEYFNGEFVLRLTPKRALTRSYW